MIIEELARLVADEGQRSFALAISTTVRRGMRVLDVGTGSGIHALLASRANGQVLAVDVRPAAVALARRTVIANGSSSGVELQVSDVLDLPAERAFDVIVANLSLGGMLGTFPLACERQLAPGGVAIPSRIRFHVAPVHAPERHETAFGAWRGGRLGLDFSECVRVAAASMFQRDGTAWRPLSPPRVITDISLAAPREASRGDVAGTFCVQSAGSLHGIGLWHELTFDDGSSVPPDIEGVRPPWYSSFFPLEQPVPVADGDLLAIRLAWRAFPNGWCCWQWRVTRGAEILCDQTNAMLPLELRTPRP